MSTCVRVNNLTVSVLLLLQQTLSLNMWNNYKITQYLQFENQDYNNVVTCSKTNTNHLDDPTMKRLIHGCENTETNKK